MKHTAKPETYGSLLEHRSRGVTTLHHYERISSRDLGWHRIENGRGRGKTKLLLRPMSETKEPCEVKQLERRIQRR